jgi:hypothetical protein
MIYLRYEITIQHSIGFTGFWKGRIVAIKVLFEVTLFAVFLGNPLIIRTFTSATAEPPWYLISPYLKHGSLDKFLKRIFMHPSWTDYREAQNVDKR